MIIGIGTDICKVSRFENAKDNLLDRFLSEKDKEYVSKFRFPLPNISGFWAAKEAISKALGCGIGSQLAFHDIILSKNDRGAPLFRLTDEAQKIHHIKTSSLSISHDGGFAIAVAVID